MAGFEAGNLLRLPPKGTHGFGRSHVRRHEDGIAARPAGEDQVQHPATADAADFGALEAVSGRCHGRHLSELQPVLGRERGQVGVAGTPAARLAEDHFGAMIDTRRFIAMNWSMLADGLLFWWLMLAPRQAQGSTAIGYGTRLVILALVAIPQLLLGAYITLHSTPLYDVYAVCGRAFAISPLDDQQLGGLLTWIPAAMMSLVGIITVLYHILHDPEATAVRPRGRPSPAVQPAQRSDLGAPA